MTDIVGIMGPAGSGKSTAAKHLVDFYGAKRYAFADPLKRLAIEVFEFTEAQVFGSQADKETVDPRYGLSPRVFLQRLGVAARKIFGEDFWVRQCLERIMRESPKLAVIDDVRFVNEATAVMGAGGRVLRMEPMRTGASTADANHVSETQWTSAPYDVRIAPREYGIASLLAEVDRAAAFCGMRASHTAPAQWLTPQSAGKPAASLDALSTLDAEILAHLADLD